MKNYTKYSTNQHDAHLARVERFVALIKPLFTSANKEFANIAMKSDYKFDGSEQFFFDDYPALKKEANVVVSKLAIGLESLIGRSTSKEWMNANADSDSFVLSVLRKVGITSKEDAPDDLVAYFNNHQDALKSFQSRVIGGMSLSDRVWNLAEHQRLEAQLGISLSEGKSAHDLALELQQYLNRPDDLFRRVRDQFGNLKLSKNAQEYHPGTGVYRSSYRNALRLARNEINMAYRSAEQERLNDFDFVVGYEVKRSTHEYECNDICEMLKGKYPKWFRFTGWHVNCRCFVVPILCTDDELESALDARRDGREYELLSENTVSDVPWGFKDWVIENENRIKDAENEKRLPYFIKDNNDIVKSIIKANGPKGNDEYFPSFEDVSKEYKIRLEDDAVFDGSAVQKFNLVETKREIGEILQEHGLEIGSCSVRMYDSGYWRVNWDSKLSMDNIMEDEDFRLSREFVRRSNGWEVRHEFFALNERLQGKGIAKKVLASLYPHYRDIGASVITLEANMDVGGYAWAKYGFYAVDKQAALDAVKNHLELTAKANDLIEEWYSKNKKESDAPFPMILIANQPWGRNVLFGSNWMGVLNLKNREQRVIFETYLGLR